MSHVMCNVICFLSILLLFTFCFINHHTLCRSTDWPIHIVSHHRRQTNEHNYTKTKQEITVDSNLNTHSETNHASCTRIDDTSTVASASQPRHLRPPCVQTSVSDSMRVTGVRVRRRSLVNLTKTVAIRAPLSCVRASASAAVALRTEQFMNGTSSMYIEDMYQAWKTDPNSVHKVCRACVAFHGYLELGLVLPRSRSGRTTGRRLPAPAGARTRFGRSCAWRGRRGRRSCHQRWFENNQRPSKCTSDYSQLSSETNLARFPCGHCYSHAAITSHHWIHWASTAPIWMTQFRQNSNWLTTDYVCCLFDVASIWMAFLKCFFLSHDFFLQLMPILTVTLYCRSPRRSAAAAKRWNCAKYWRD
jgi:hypothetical protein